MNEAMNYFCIRNAIVLMRAMKLQGNGEYEAVNAMKMINGVIKINIF